MGRRLEIVLLDVLVALRSVVVELVSLALALGNGLLIESIVFDLWVLTLI